jgi:hypothetical protein
MPSPGPARDRARQNGGALKGCAPTIGVAGGFAKCNIALGIDAQRAAVARFADIVAEFVEVETGKGSDALERRPQLSAALAEARRHGKVCPVVVAKLDRLSRDVAFVAALMVQKVPSNLARTPIRQGSRTGPRAAPRGGKCRPTSVMTECQD